ncbi:MAG: DHH family phosphoesterase [Planctomycetes bacterium]|nr:DHH family phosphoesterase [Planctomycetota bacterium]
MSGPAAVARALEGARRVVIVSHVPPDGDGLGAGLALARALGRLGREAVFAAGGSLPPTLRSFARPGEVDTSPGGPPGPFDLALALDCADEARLGALATTCRAVPLVVNLDHHETNTRFGHLSWIDPASPAVGEMAMRVLAELGTPLDADLALPLLLALVTDTGRFGYGNTTPATLRAAADLLDAGADPQAVTDAVYRSASAAWYRLLGLALAGLELAAGGLVSHVTVTPAMIEESGADPLCASDVVDYPISVEGVEVGVLFRPASDGKATKVSLRSRRIFPVHAFAARFGGGGHPRAAGATVDLPLAAAREMVLATLLPEVLATCGAVMR